MSILETPDPVHEEERKTIAKQIEEFLANGGEVQHLEPGATTLDHDYD